jgi:hypothetical protein
MRRNLKLYLVNGTTHSEMFALRFRCYLCMLTESHCWCSNQEPSDRVKTADASSPRANLAWAAQVKNELALASRCSACEVLVMWLMCNIITYIICLCITVTGICNQTYEERLPLRTCTVHFHLAVNCVQGMLSCYCMCKCSI